MARPRLKYFIQCDEVQHGNGKFSALGIFDTIFSFIFPTSHKRFFVLAGFLGEPGAYAVELQVLGPDGAIVGSTKGEVRIENEEQIANAVFSFDAFPLPKEGRYTISLFTAGDFLAEYHFYARPPFPRRERTPEEIASLLQRTDVIRSANADVSCGRCNTTYRFQMQLDPAAPVDNGFVKMPPGDTFLCGKCQAPISLAQVRQNLENIVGIPQQWLNIQNPTPPAHTQTGPEMVRPDEGGH